jgi:hypothetical protein
LQTESRTELLVSPRCYHEHQVTLTYEHWSSAAGKYVPYTAGPRRTVVDQTKCHA